MQLSELMMPGCFFIARGLPLAQRHVCNLAPGKQNDSFPAPRCGHCKNLKPAYIEAASELKGRVKLGAVDCTAHQSVCSEYGVQVRRAAAAGVSAAHVPN